ncbi:YbgA family protein [Actinorugispora endophytica]|uniref:Uncharacterized protein YbgA (DUF1722 family) n=1 Tax=Actinorugispora endophytica TaxID=1605990 RepID=A0A4R6V382_9ACTN|nr:DUF523 and DUF1722 domain-containing protein [Actinorugispora endophytica]TDQ54711.1 uncharacterized protein YbgA (DUF1722 family) [Actinorugispora endophytica]
MSERSGGTRPRVGVSSCLLGAPVRYNGGHSRNRFLAEVLDRYVDWKPVCPETEIGLGAPRETLRLNRVGGAARAVATRSGTDHTGDLAAVADRHLAGLRELDGYVLKNRSPSCGLFGMPVFEDGRRVDGRGRGVFAARLTELCPEVPVEEQGRLSDEGLREHFVERVFARARLRALFTGDWRPRDLVAFHSRHKLQLMAHEPDGYRRTGRVAARAGTDGPEAVRDAYTAAFSEAMALRATRGKHVNVLQHAFGMVGPLLDGVRRQDVLDAIDGYQEGHLPLCLPVRLLRHHSAAEGVAWVREQSYLEPYPDRLALRNTASPA